MSDMQTEIRQFVVDNFLFGQSDKPFSNSDSFLEAGIIDSTGVLELITFIESHFGISVDDDELVPANLDSVDRLANFVQRKRELKGANVG
jgi:acyl carrier protein